MKKFKTKLFDALSLDNQEKIIKWCSQDVIDAVKEKNQATELTFYEAMMINWAIFGERSVLDYDIFTSLFNQI